jgi:8-oxo-dGTP diphosphatase
VVVGHLTGVYYIDAYNSQCFIFRCQLTEPDAIVLSEEHSEYGYFPVAELGAAQRRRVEDCLQYAGVVASDKF